MRATDELRAELTKRSVFLIDIPLVNMKRTCWKSSDEQDGYCYFDEDEFGVTELTISQLTPEQAIAATLGAGTCHMRLAYEEEDADDCIWPDHYECDACGANVNGIMPYPDTEVPPHFCPNCGRRVVAE